MNQTDTSCLDGAPFPQIDKRFVTAVRGLPWLCSGFFFFFKLFVAQGPYKNKPQVEFGLGAVVCHPLV